MTDEEETINWINERKKGSDLMSKLLNKKEQLEKENEQWKQEWQDAQIKANEEGFARTQLQIKYSKLEKENAELIDKLNLQNQRLNELKKENEELLESCRDKDRQLNNWFISYNEVIKENEQLKQQIEKMKNVGNCKHSITCAEWNEKQLYLGTMKFCKNCKEWELAE